MPYCVVKKCRNTSANLKKDSGLSFHRFPKEPTLRNKWVNALRKNREDKCWLPSTYCVICSEHFQESDLSFTKTGLRRLNKNAIPTNKILITSEVCEVILEDHSDSDSSLHFTSSSTTKKSTCSNQLPTDPVPGTSADISSSNAADLDTDSIFDTESIYDTPLITHLKNKSNKYQTFKLNTRRKLKCLQQKLRRFKKKNDSLKCILKDLEKKTFANVGTQKNLSVELVPTEIFHNLYMRRKGKKNLIFSPAMRKFCQTLDFYSPKAYEYVRKCFNTCLPHRKTLAKWQTRKNEVTDFKGESLTALKKEDNQSSPVLHT